MKTFDRFACAKVAVLMFSKAAEYTAYRDKLSNSNARFDEKC